MPERVGTDGMVQRMRPVWQSLVLAVMAALVGCGQQSRYDSDSARPPTLDERQTGPIFQPRPPVPPNPATGSAPSAQP
jgi:hypothetical protein